MAKSKTKKSKENTDTIVLEEEQSSSWYYFYSVGCGFCKKVDPIVDELNSEGHDILRLDISNSDNKNIIEEIKKEYNIQCGTPLFVNSETGKFVCGYREKDVLEKWLAGEDIPEPPRPTGPPPRPPFHGASKKEEKTWKKEYNTWLNENEHLPQTKTAEEILSMPRPKSEPPRPPMGPDVTDKQYEAWSKEWDKWTKENSHLPNLQPSDKIIEGLKRRQTQPSQVPPQPVDNAKLNSLEAKFSALEVKIDKIMSHFGVK
jgi:thiol-disulfide isomerase/thioredoxin